MKQLLTGKCLEDFEHYLSCIDLCDDSDLIDYDYSNEDIMNGVCLSMQWGVIQDFADSVKMPFFVKHVENYIYEVTYDFWVYGYGWGENFKTRSQAQEEAIKHFNKIYNSTKQTESI